MGSAVVIGAGPNGLVAANILADAGWDVIVLEAEDEPGGAVRSGELAPGVVYDRYSAFYPLAAVSPPLHRLQLEQWGLRWRHAPDVLAHVFEDGEAAILSTDPMRTAASVEALSPGDGDAWLAMLERWREVSPPMLQALLDGPLPPVRAATRLLARLGPRDTVRLIRTTLLSVRRFCEEQGFGRGASMLIAGNALHSDLTPESSLGGIFGWMLSMIGQEFGYPVPEGGSGRLTDALVRRLHDKGGRLRCNAPVERIEIANGRAVAVRTRDGERYPARAILADVNAPALYFGLVGEEHLPSGVAADVRRFQFDNATFKVDWLVRGPVPWTATAARTAGTVHVAAGMEHLDEIGMQLSQRKIPKRPFLVVGQPSMADPTRAPAGSNPVWAYTHVPQDVAGDAGGTLSGKWDSDEVERFVERMEDMIEAHAPGFRDLVEARRVLSPSDLESENRNLRGGAVGGGTSSIHQQLIFRPIPGMGRPETPFKGLYLASASAHPGGGVHGACGANAARAAIGHERTRKTVYAVAAAASVAALASAAKERSWR